MAVSQYFYESRARTVDGRLVKSHVVYRRRDNGTTSRIVAYSNPYKADALTRLLNNMKDGEV